MPARSSQATWEGDLKAGHGTVKLGSHAWEGPYSFASRFEDGGGTNPEELIAAAHAGCFSMALANALSQASHPPTSVKTAARVFLEKKGEAFTISRIELEAEAQVPGMDDTTFHQHAEEAKRNCPVSRALGQVPVSLVARLTR